MARAGARAAAENGARLRRGYEAHLSPLLTQSRRFTDPQARLRLPPVWRWPPHGAFQGSLSNKTALAMIFKLAEAAEKSWRRLDGHNQFPKIILGFADGIEVVRPQAQPVAA